MLKIAICDDCFEHQNLVKEYISLSKNINTKYKITTFNSGIELCKSNNLQEFNLVYLDIIMDNMDGIETLRHLKNSNCYIIFMSTTNDRLRELFQKNVIGFLDKPLTLEDFQDKFDIFINLYNSEQTKIFTVEKQGIPRHIPEHEILYFENIGHYIHIHTIKEVITFKEKISHLWDCFIDNISFAMPNRSFIINLKYSSLLTKNSIKLEYNNNWVEISIGRTKKDETLERLIRYASAKGGV